MKRGSSAKTVFFDSNVLVYADDAQNPEKQATALSLLQRRMSWLSGATTLYTEDLQHGRRIEGLQIINPFLENPRDPISR